MDIASRLHEIEKKKFALLQTLAGLPLRITNRFVSMEKGVHCTLNIYCNPVGIVGEGGRNTRSASIQRRRRRSRGATLFPWQEHAIRQEGRHLTSDSSDIRVSWREKIEDR